MKLITAFLHHVRVAAVVDALNDAGYTNYTLQDVIGTLKPLEELEQVYSTETRMAISEAKLVVICEDAEVDKIAGIIGVIGRIGSGVCGWMYVSTIDQTLPIIGQNVKS